MRHFCVFPTCPGVSGQVLIFWGALEFFVVESSGVTGTPESDSQLFCHVYKTMNLGDCGLHRPSQLWTYTLLNTRLKQQQQAFHPKLLSHVCLVIFHGSNQRRRPHGCLRRWNLCGKAEEGGRHERMSIAAVLATVSNHSYPKVDTKNDAPRGQKTVTSTRVGPAEYHELSSDDGRRCSDTQASGPNSPIIDGPVLQMVEQLPDVLQF